MSVAVSQSPRARKDVVGYYAFIANRDMAAADRFLDAYSESLRTIGEHPGIGSARLQSHPALRNVRAWPVRGSDQFIIYYRQTDGRVRILRVLRGSVPPEAVLRTPE